MQNIVLSFSGGKTSAYMTYRCLTELSANWLILFANTGEEREETLDFVHRCDKHLFNHQLVWLEAKVNEYGQGTTYTKVDYHTASRKGEPFENVIKKYGIPNIKYPHCTRELKIRPMHKYAKEYFKGNDYISYIGIRADEIDRMQDNPKVEYPLVDWNITKADVNSFWKSMPFNLDLQPHEGNCKVCFKKSRKKLLQLAKDNPSLFDFFLRMENEYTNYLPYGKNPSKYKLPVRFFRQSTPVESILIEAQEGSAGNQYSLDFDYACGASSCEAF